MANTRAAKRAIRQSARRNVINSARRSRIRTYVRKLEEAIASGDRDAAMAAFQKAQPELARGAQKGVMHRNTASRKISRLTKRLREM